MQTLGTTQRRPARFRVGLALLRHQAATITPPRRPRRRPSPSRGGLKPSASPTQPLRRIRCLAPANGPQMSMWFVAEAVRFLFTLPLTGRSLPRT